MCPHIWLIRPHIWLIQILSECAPIFGLFAPIFGLFANSRNSAPMFGLMVRWLRHRNRILSMIPDLYPSPIPAPAHLPWSHWSRLHHWYQLNKWIMPNEDGVISTSKLKDWLSFVMRATLLRKKLMKLESMWKIATFPKIEVFNYGTDSTDEPIP